MESNKESEVTTEGNKESEYSIQKAFVSWCRSHPDLRARRIYAIPNEGRRRYSEAQRRHAEGMVAGVADLHLPVPIPSKLHPGLLKYPGLFIEVKTTKGRQTSPQKAFQMACEADAYPYRIIRSVDEGIDLITNYLSI